MAVNMSGTTHISAAGRARTEVTMVVIVPTIGTVVTIIIVVNNINLQMIFHGFLNFFKFKKSQSFSRYGQSSLGSPSFSCNGHITDHSSLNCSSCAYL